MPTYDYQCGTCGPFEQIRPVSQRDAPTTCPQCRAEAARILAGSPRVGRGGGDMGAMLAAQEAGSYPRMRHPRRAAVASRPAGNPSRRFP